MCTGLEIAALVASVGGTGAQVAGADAQKRGNARSQDQQTQFSAGEFNIRDQLAKQVFAENTGISREVYDELNALDDQSFAERTGLSKQAFNQLSEIERQQVVRDAAASDANIAEGRDIRLGRDAEQDAARLERDTAQDAIRLERDSSRDAARAQYEADLAAGNAVQTGYRGQAQGEANALLRAFTPEAMAGRRTSAASARDAAVQSAISPQGATGPAGNVDPVLAAAFKKYSDSGRSAAMSTAGARSKLMSYSDATGEGDRSISRADENVAMIADEARRALTPLGAQLDVSSLKYNNAGALGDARYGAAGEYGATRYNNATANARGRSTASDADLEAALGLSSTRAGGEARGVTAYTGAQDEALSRFFTGRSGSAANRGNTLISANDAKLQGSAQVSQNLENGMNNITQFRMQNQGTSPWTALGQFASAVTPTLFNQAAQNGTGFGFRKPAPTPTIAT